MTTKPFLRLRVSRRLLTLCSFLSVFLFNAVSLYLTLTLKDVLEDQNKAGQTQLSSSFAKVDLASSNATTRHSKHVGSPYCYAFLVSGTDEQKPAYRGFLYNILVATKILRDEGSTSDIHVFFRMSPQSKLDTLPSEDVRILQEMNITFEYLPKPKYDSFYHTQLEKFNILRLTQYRRVLYMDADIMPLTNLDYLFHLSDGENPLIQENLVVATLGEPSNGGFFMLSPKQGDYEQVTEIIQLQRERDKLLPKGFDFKLGWGHDFKRSGDMWEGVKQKGNRWKFYGGHVDQGLLYYWVKYHKKQVSIVIGDRIQHWNHNETGQLRMDHYDEKLFDNYTTSTAKFHQSYPYFLEFPPYRDYVHFSGKKKPWNGEVPRNYDPSQHPRYYWHQNLQQLNDQLKIGLDMEHWNEVELPQLGLPLFGIIPEFQHPVLTNVTS